MKPKPLNPSDNFIWETTTGDKVPLTTQDVTALAALERVFPKARAVYFRNGKDQEWKRL